MHHDTNNFILPPNEHGFINKTMDYPLSAAVPTCGWCGDGGGTGGVAGREGAKMVTAKHWWVCCFDVL